MQCVVAVRSALEWLQAEVQSSNCNLGSAAHSNRVSKFHLSRLITRSTGYGWRTHLRGLRLLSAVDLLDQCELSIKEVAARSEYGDTATMDHEFQRWLHMTPREYRGHRLDQTVAG